MIIWLLMIVLCPYVCAYTYREDTVHRDGHKKFIIFLRMYGDLYTNSYNAFLSARDDPYVKSGALSVDELPNKDFQREIGQ